MLRSPWAYLVAILHPLHGAPPRHASWYAHATPLVRQCIAFVIPRLPAPKPQVAFLIRRWLQRSAGRPKHQQTEVLCVWGGGGYGGGNRGRVVGCKGGAKGI